MNSYLRWGNITTTVRWNRVLSDKLFSNATATLARYVFDVGSRDLDTETQTSNRIRYLSKIRDVGIAADFDFVPSPAHYLRFGASGTLFEFSPGALQVRSTTDEDDAEAFTLVTPKNEIDAVQYAAYVEDDLRLGPSLKLIAGLRLSGYSVNNRDFVSLLPRASARYLLPSRWALKASYAEMRQYIFLLQNNSVGLPTDLWLPTTAKVPAQEGYIVAAGTAHTLSSGQLEFSLEGYYKGMRNLVEYKNGAQFLSPEEDWQDKVELGKGWSYGTEILLRKQTGKITGWIGYTLSWTYRRFDRLNGGRKFPFKHDRRHDFSVVAVHQLRPGIELSGVWTYATGSALTLPSTTYRVGQFATRCPVCTVTSYGQRNGFRMRAYHRMDLGINFKKRRGRKERTLSAGIYNVYNRKNPFFLEPSDSGDPSVLTQISLVPILPYVTYKRTF